MDTEQTKRAWHFSGTSIAALLLLTFLFYQQTVLYLIGLWNQLEIGEYAHGYLVLAISGYLIFNNRQRLAKLTPSVEYRALLGVIAASMLWLIAALVDVQMLQTVSLLFLILALVWTVLGNQIIRELAFPILFIAFAIPIWFPLSPILQNLAADGVFSAIRILNIPAFRQDNMIILPAGTLSVEEACSGLRYLLAALTLGTLYAYMNYLSLRARLIVVLIAAGSAVLANILRVFIVVYLAYTTDMQHSLVHDHLYLGWYLFAGLVTILLFLDAYLQKGQPLLELNESKTKSEMPPIVYNKNLPYHLIVTIGCSLLLALAPGIVYQSNTPSTADPVNMAPTLPSQAGFWSESPIIDDDWMPVYHGAINQKQFYQKDNNKLNFYMGYYPVQKQGAELINDLNSISNRKVWQTTYPRARQLSITNHSVLEQLLDNNAKKQKLVWYWYNVAGNVTTNKYEAKFLQVLGLLTGKSWAFIAAASVQTGNDLNSSRQILKDFISSIDKPMQEELKQMTAIQ